MAASLTNNNPLAQWENQWTRLFGSTGVNIIGGGNHIASFADPIAGASANVATMQSVYGGSTISDMIRRWSGGNSWQSYLATITGRSGVDPNAIVSDVLAGPQGPAFLSSMAQWEAGQPGALTPEQWALAIANGTAAVSGNFRPAAPSTQPAPRDPEPGSGLLS